MVQLKKLKTKFKIDYMKGKTKMKKFLCTLLCLMLVFTMMPMATGVAFAGSKPKVSYDIWIGGTTVTNLVTSGTGWSYCSSTNTLTLTSSFINVEENNLKVAAYNNSVPTGYFICSERDNLTIDFAEDITISTNITSSTNDYAAIGGTGNIAINGKGTLNISSFTNAIADYCKKELIVGTNTSLNCNTLQGVLFLGNVFNYGTFTSIRTTEGSSGAITCNNINQYGTIIAGGGSVGVSLLNEKSDNGILTNYGTINVTSTSAGIFFGKGTLTNYGTVTSTGNGEGSYGIKFNSSGNLINNGCIIAIGNKDGIFNQEGSLTNNGTITASGTNIGIYFHYGSFTNNGTVTSIGNGEESYGFHIVEPGEIVNQKGGILNSMANGEGSIGIELADGTLTNFGCVTASGGKCGIYNRVSNEDGDFEILVSEEIGGKLISTNLEAFNGYKAYLKYVKISPKTKEEPKPTPSYHGSTIDYAQYQAILEQAQKQQAELDAKKAEEEKLEKHEKLVKEAKAVIKKTEFKATSTKQTKLNGKKAVKIKWEVVGGEYNLSDFDGFDIYRSAKKNSGYTKTPFFTTTKWTYTNNKDLKAGKTYYYKVRAWKMVDGEKVYTGWSTKAWRTVK